MNLKDTLFTPRQRQTLEHTFLVRHRLEEQYATLEHQHETAAFGMWVFLATEVMFFGTLFIGVATYVWLYAPVIEKASIELKWQIGSINTIVLLVSSLTMVLAVHFAKLGNQRLVVRCLLITAGLGIGFLCLKGFEYFLDYRENLVPGWKFDAHEWVLRGVPSDQVGRVKIFLIFYWIMTGFHALHVTIGIGAVLTIAVLAHRGHFSTEYYTPVDVTGLYWHFVDIVWIFLLPTLYLLGTHTTL
jgi:cytochrome c oxidase subunit 3